MSASSLSPMLGAHAALAEAKNQPGSQLRFGPCGSHLPRDWPGAQRHPDVPAHAHVLTHVYMYIHINTCVCVNVCICLHPYNICTHAVCRCRCISMLTVVVKIYMHT